MLKKYSILIAMLTALPAMAGNQLVLVKDMRPVDGALMTLTVEEARGDQYEATLTAEWTDRRTGQTRTETTLIGRYETCDQSGSQSYVNTVLTCSLDRRPVDGALTQLLITKDGNGSAATFSATKLTSYIDRTTGKTIENTELVGSGFEIAE